MAKPRQNIVFRGYTKKENGQWVAICVDLNIAAQADTKKGATELCIELILEYLDYVCSKYPDKFRQFVPRFAPDELFREYDEAVRRALISFRRPTRRKSHEYAVPYTFGINPSKLSQCAAQ